MQAVAPRGRTVDLAYPVIVVGYAVLAVSVIAPVAAGLGVVAARLAGPEGMFAVAFSTTAVVGLFSGFLATPALRRRVGRPGPPVTPVARGPAGHGGPGGP